MPNPAPTAEPAQPVDPAVDDDALVAQTLRILLQAGAQLIQEIADDPLTPPVAKAEPYERVARSIRRTIVLGRHVAESPVEPAPSPAERRTQARRQIIRDLESAIETRAERPEQAESLKDELNERLDDPEFERDLATRPIPDIIRDLKRDLGLDHSHSERHPRRTPAEVEALNARAAAPPKPAGFQPGQTRPNPLLDRYRHPPDG